MATEAPRPVRTGAAGLFRRRAVPSLPDMDLRILRELRAEPRITLRALARNVGLSPRACRRRWTALENAGVIRGYRVEIDEAAIRPGVAAWVRFRAEINDQALRGRIEAQLVGAPEVVECHRVAGFSDYVLLVKADDIAAVRSFLTDRLASLVTCSRIRSDFVAETLKR